MRVARCDLHEWLRGSRVLIHLLQRARYFLRLMIAGITLAACTAQAQQKSITSLELADAEDILSRLHKTLKEKYYDSTFHGIDIDVRYQDYLQHLKDSKTLPGAHHVIAGYLSGLEDSHTFFLPPPNSNRVTYGYRMQMVGDACFVTAVRPDTDAAQKLHPGDQIISLDAYTLNRKDLWQLEYYLNFVMPRPKSEFVLRSPSGTERRETVTAKIDPLKRMTWFSISARLHSDFDRLLLEAEQQRQLAKSLWFEQDGVLFWKLPGFFTNEADMSKMIEKARKNKSLVLDLRGNAGGAEKALTFLVSSFFDHDVKVAKKVTRKGEEDIVVKTREQEAYTGPIVVLIDSRSSSEAEVLARVVQLEHRGIVLGDRSAGRVREAQPYRLSEGDLVVAYYVALISVAELIMSDGKSLENTGVTPDTVLLPTASDLAEGRDLVLARAAEMMGSHMDATAAGKVFPFQWPPDRLTPF